jgi:hypothetical protein
MIERDMLPSRFKICDRRSREADVASEKSLAHPCRNSGKANLLTYRLVEVLAPGIFDVGHPACLPHAWGANHHTPAMFAR